MVGSESSIWAYPNSLKQLSQDGTLEIIAIYNMRPLFKFRFYHEHLTMTHRSN